MQDLQDLANKVNAQNISSCEAAASLVGGLAGSMGIQSKSVCEAVGTSKGLFSDWARAKQKCGNGGEQASTNAGASGGLKASLPGPKNYAWDMIKGSALASQSQQMREMMMTLVGTIVVPQPVSDSDEPQIQFVGPKVDTILDALLDGTQSVSILKCTDGTDCLSLASGGQTVAPLGAQALKPKVKSLIVSMGDKIRTDTELTSEERNLLGMAPIPLYKVLAVHAASGFQLSDDEIDALAEITAIDMLNGIVSNMLDQLAASRGALQAQSNQQNIEQFMSQLRDVRSRISQRETSVNQRVARTLEIIDRAQRIEASLQGKMAPGMAAALNFSRALSAQGLRP